MSHSEHSRALFIAMTLNAAIFLVEVVGGIMANSLALLSDAFHNFSDFAALLLAFVASRIALRKPTARRTYGLVRSEIIVAFVNALMLVVIGGGIVYEAIKRFFEPSQVDAPVVLGFGVIGLLANLFGASILHRPSRRDLNARAAYLHLALDAAHSLAVVVGGLLMTLSVPFVDPILSLLIGLVILKGTWDVLTETTNILAEGAPRGLTSDDVARCLREVPGVLDVHHVHVWCLSSRVLAMSAHVVVEDQRIGESQELIERMGKHLLERCNIEHPTFQLETGPCHKGSGATQSNSQEGKVGLPCNPSQD